MMHPQWNIVQLNRRYFIKLELNINNNFERSFEIISLLKDDLSNSEEECTAVYNEKYGFLPKNLKK